MTEATDSSDAGEGATPSTAPTEGGQGASGAATRRHPDAVVGPGSPSDPARPAPELGGGDRFEIVRLVGAGGMGAVYEAIDLDRGERVALKTLRNFGPLELFLFKNEFRSLSNIVHPNLVGLHELLAEGSTWFFTMDYVPGSDLLDWVRGAAAETGDGAPPAGSVPRSTDPAAPIDDTLALEELAADPSGGSTPLPDTIALEAGAAGVPSHPSAPAGASSAEPTADPLDADGIARLRPVLGQLASAIHALHRYGKLHRDIKPSNVLVDPEGRVVLLDFGLIVDLREDGDGPGSGTIAGTARYMSPEQARGEALGPATDWFALGCLLHEALSGRPAFGGTTMEIVRGKSRGQSHRPLPPEVRAAAPDLVELCEELLRPASEDRPPGGEILVRLGVDADEDQGKTLSTAALPVLSGDLVGRETQLDALSAAFEGARAGGTRVAFVHGRSGMGKSELIARVLTGFREEGALVLTSRCYEREWVPFKAVDPLIDALVEALLARGGPVPVPRQVGALVRLFPVLERIPALAAASDGESLVTEPTELRRRAVAGFADLLRRVAESVPIVLFVDDLQWSDFDSVYVFEELLGEPTPPPLLLLGAYRDEEAATSKLLQAFSGLVIGAGRAPVEQIEVGPLSAWDARNVAAARLGELGDDLAESIAEESGGIPFFIDELARYVRSVPEGSWRGVLHLDEVVRSRVEALPDVARELLEVAAIAGQPTGLPLLARAQNIAEAWKVATVLQTEHLLHSLGGGVGRDARVECYHDRIREAVFASLSEVRARTLHLALADGFEAEENPDAERLSVHLLEAGERARALPWVCEAARRADQALAFERAAWLYGRAVEIEEDDGARRRLRIAQAQALVNAGRGVEAANAYLAAAAGASTEDAWRLTQAAADQLLRAGRLEQGNELVQQVLVEAGMRIPASELGIILRYVGNRIRLSFRGLGFQERPASELSTEELGRLDVALSASTVLAMTDTLAGALMHSRNLEMALDAGEPYRVVRALGVEASFAAVVGMKGEAKANEVLDTAWGLSERLGDPRAVGFSTMTRALVRFQAGRWKESAEAASEASRILLGSCRGMHYEVGLARAYELADLAWLGRLRDFAACTADWIDEATDRGDLNAWLLLQLGGPIQVGALTDDPQSAAEQVLDVRGRWPDARFGILDVYVQRTLVDLALYRGDAAAAVEHARTLWTGLFKGQLKMVAILKATANSCLGRALLAAGGREKEVARCGKRLDPFGPGWGLPHAALLRAPGSGVEGWRAALLACEAGDMAMHAAAARWRLGEALGGDEGAAERAAAEAWLGGEGVVKPERIVAMLAPGG